MAGWLASAPALAQIAPECTGVTTAEDYDDVVQADFLLNYVALATTLSPVHAPIPHEPGHGAVGVDVGIIPPLSCERRLVLSGTKTEDTNKTPVVPRLRGTFAFDLLDGKIVPYLGLAYVPPVQFLGTTNVIASGEIGIGVPVGDKLQLGGRYHYTLQKTVGEIATPFVAEDPAYDDLYLASTFGLDAMVGVDLGIVVPYAAIGFTDASTFFYIGDDGVVSNNTHPYAGPVASLGVDALLAERFRVAGEYYGAFGGYSLPDESMVRSEQASAGRYGHLHTARLRFALEL
ncbi:MAG: hypothetical protein H0V89_04945 [Deltaproteobacteria bacterium]|nr:hypothetical protein [Deltaproteobacteria bacterium]